jgi:phospholipid/cholesterol/gamma-HCH transport system substrate-binding protein
MTKKSTEILVGLFVLLGALALVFLALQSANLLKVAQLSGTGTYTVQARFDNIGGLKVRAPVRSAGVEIGRVKRIALDPKTYQGLVTMELRADVDFPKDSSAKILTSGLLGDQYIGLEPGAEEQNLKDGDTVELTQSAIVLESLISQFLFSGNSKSSSSSSNGAAATPAAPAASGAQP